MNKSIMAACLLGALCMPATAEQHTDYLSKGISVSLFQSANEFTADLQGVGSTDLDNDSSGLNISFNWQNRNGMFFHVGYQYEDFDLGIYDEENNPLHSVVGGIGKEWRMDNGLSPYINGALSVGLVTIDDSIYSDDIAAAIGIKGGAGLAYYITPSWRIHLGGELQYRTWTAVETGAGELEIEDTGVIWSFGVRKLF